MPITRATPQQRSGVPLTYTNSFIDVTEVNAEAIQVFSAAQNPNGAYVELITVTGTTNINTYYSEVTFLAKATAPANGTDGDVIARVLVGPLTNQTQIQRIKIPEGKGLFINQKQSGGTMYALTKNVLFTLL